MILNLNIKTINHIIQRKINKKIIITMTTTTTTTIARIKIKIRMKIRIRWTIVTITIAKMLIINLINRCILDGTHKCIKNT
jgi:hypothetical protein